MKEIKVKGIKVYYNKKNIKIKDSYKITSIEKVNNILKDILEKIDNDYFNNSNRKFNSLRNEWIAHNILYNFHIFRKCTKDTDLESKINFILNIIYFLISFPIIFFNFIKKKIYNLKKKKMEKKYIKYIEEHRDNIVKAYNEFSKNKLIINFLEEKKISNILNDLLNRIAIHDKSKYSEEEFEPYRKNFFPVNEKEKEENKELFKKALEHHLKNNSHHWQARQNKKSFDENNKEQVLDVFENILDWMAMGYKFNDRPYIYYNNNKNNIILCDEEKIFLKKIIDMVDNEYIDKEKNK